jgi:hypothetical protein
MEYTKVHSCQCHWNLATCNRPYFYIHDSCLVTASVWRLTIDNIIREISTIYIRS